MSMDTLAGIEPLREPVAERREAIRNWLAGGSERHQADVAAWEAKLDPFSEAEVKPHDAAFDDAAWSKVELPQPFEKHVAPDFNGVVWYRLRVTLSAAQAGGAAVFKLDRSTSRTRPTSTASRSGACPCTAPRAATRFLPGS